MKTTSEQPPSQWVSHAAITEVSFVIVDNGDFYDTVQALVRQLAEAGEEQWSSALNDALAISTVPGEILGETRLQLQNLRDTQVPDLLGFRWRIDEALSYLDKTLGSAKV